MVEKELVGVVTQKGQVTIPVEIRRLLGIKPRSRVVFRVEEGKVRLIVEAETLESIYGAVTPLHRPEDFQALRDQVIEEKVAQTLEEMGITHDVS